MRNHVIFCVMFLAISISPTHQSHNSGTIQFPSEATYGTSNEFSVQKRHVYDEDPSDIVFPDEISRPFDDLVGFPCNADGKGTKCIDGVCEDAIDYPYDYIQKIKDRLSTFKDAFGSFQGDSVEVGVRRKQEQEISLCTTTVYTRYPKTLKNEQNVEKFIVNVEGHLQGLIFETCGKKNGCMFSPLFPSNYKSECTQRYMTRRLMSLGDNGKPEFDSFVIPSCCMCMVKEIKA